MTRHRCTPPRKKPAVDASARMRDYTAMFLSLPTEKRQEVLRRLRILALRYLSRDLPGDFIPSNSRRSGGGAQ